MRANSDLKTHVTVDSRNKPAATVVGQPYLNHKPEKHKKSIQSMIDQFRSRQKKFTLPNMGSLDSLRKGDGTKRKSLFTDGLVYPALSSGIINTLSVPVLQNTSL